MKEYLGDEVTQKMKRELEQLNLGDFGVQLRTDMGPRTSFQNPSDEYGMPLVISVSGQTIPKFLGIYYESRKERALVSSDDIGDIPEEVIAVLEKNGVALRVAPCDRTTQKKKDRQNDAIKDYEK
ncbi:MAG: hypothetical protein V1492_00810 [Candidatus Micrarchaeota archaeon]